MVRSAKHTQPIYAPMAGILRSLDTVPDLAFAQRLVGDGFAIDPLDDRVRAPFSGTVVTVAETGHAVTMRSPDGVEVLIHVGIDTVGLKGRGFNPQVKAGQAVSIGDVLVELDIDMIGREARSLLTPIVVVSGHRCTAPMVEMRAISAGDVLLLAECQVPNRGQLTTVSSRHSTHQIKLVVGLPHGLHARPSGRIAILAKSFSGKITIFHETKTADATSVTALMSLGCRKGSEIKVEAVGASPRKILAALTKLLNQLADAEHGEAGPQPVALPPRSGAASAIHMSDAAIPAVVASPGHAVGPVFRLESVDMAVVEEAFDAEAELVHLADTLVAVTEQLTTLISSSQSTAKAIAEAHLAILQDDGLRLAAERQVRSGSSAAFAWRSTSRSQESALEATGISRLQERAIDLRAVERRVIAQLSGIAVDAGTAPPRGSILVCDDIDPSVLMSIPGNAIVGICTARGGRTSHAAIIAASRSTPMLVAAGEGIAVLENGQIVLLDAEVGLLDPLPTPAEVQRVTEMIAARSLAAQSIKRASRDECRLADGTRIEVFANLASVADARDAIENGAEGCGLLRTEFIFADSPTLPDEAAQRCLYAEIADALQGKPLIIRTLDAGSDKPIAYLPFAAEVNPALGMRGIRFALAENEILRTQLRAMIQSVPAHQLRIMLPMIVEVDEIVRVRAIVQSECQSIGVDPAIQIGIMIETPAAALLADRLAAHADFLSVGSNDLTQYVLAMDRGNALLAPRVDAYHPAVLRAIDLTAHGASRHGRWLGICGGLASDARAAPLLVGLGCQELSAVAATIPQIKQTLRNWTIDRCRALASQALKQDSAAAVRALIEGEVG